MTSPTKHCRVDQIDLFLAGKLSPVGLSELEEHLSECRECDQLLSRRTAEPDFWKDVQTFLGSSDRTRSMLAAPADEIVEPDLLRFLDATDDPQMLGRFAGYEISGVVGRGGMGVVLKGRDVSLDRFVAIKVLDPRFAGNSAARHRFAREAQAAAAVVHDNVISIYGVDQWNGLPFLVMPYIKGQSLQQRIDQSAPLLVEDVLGIALQIARGLAAAHDQGLVHRDIKPANILMPASVSRVIITDFGLARAADDASLTRSGVIAGTPQYMSPEQAKGEPVDGRTDLFSLGSVMYAMACGHPPFRADTVFGVLRRITDHPYRPLSQVQSDSPAWLDEIIERLLRKEPSQRFSTATELAGHLEDCLAHVRQPTTTLLPKLERESKSGLLRPIAFVCGAALLVILVWFALFGPELRRETAQTDRPVETERLRIDVADQSHLDWEYEDADLTRLERELEEMMTDD